MLNHDIGAANNRDQVTIVIPVKNGADVIGQQVQALADQDYFGHIHLVVSDNGSNDDLPGALAGYEDRFASFRIVDAGQRPGAAHARNQGLLAAETEKILFCDADDQVEQQWVTELSRGLDHGDLVGGPLHVRSINVVDERLALDDIVEPPSTHGYLQYPLTSNAGVRRQIALAVGGFDSSFAVGHEDVDFAWRVQQQGGLFLWCPQAIVHYRQRASTRAAIRQRFNYAQTAILLWARFEDRAELSPVSFQGSVRHLASNLLRAPKLLHPSTRRSQAMALGWTAGTVAGHLKYRFRPAPPRELMDAEPA